ncbi:MAG: TRAP transporter large permease subunit [Candidatus Latescibacteria bacterium]|nr:TRAP transporter large permease subunit [Candidatus Latescibacterota bacterium]
MTSLLGGLLALAGVPLFIIIALLALLHYHWAEVDPTALFISMYQIAQIPTLSAIPLFAFTGFLLAESQAANRLVRLSQTLLGWLPGGLAIMAIFICALFTALTGASGMTIVALGGLLYPALIKNRFPDGFSLGLLTTSGSLGLLFPPSLPLIVFGIVSQTPVDQLFIAGIVPGLLLVGALSLYSFAKGTRVSVQRAPLSWAAIVASLRESIWELLLPIVILGGIYTGLIAVSEAAALSVLYILFVEVVVHREIKLRQLPGIVRDCMVLVGGIIIVLGAAMGYTNYLIDAEIPKQLLVFIQQHIDSRLVFLLALNLFLLAVGCMIDMYSALLVVVPLILPIAHAYEIHPVHLGIIFLTNLEIGYSTPPVGLNLFIASLRFDKPILKLYLASLPFLGILLVALALITYFPQLSLFLLD